MLKAILAGSLLWWGMYCAVAAQAPGAEDRTGLVVSGLLGCVTAVHLLTRRDDVGEQYQPRRRRGL